MSNYVLDSRQLSEVLIFCYNSQKSGKNFRKIAIISFGGFVTFSALSVLNYNETTYKNIVLPIFQLFDPEKAHNLVLSIYKYHGIIPSVEMQNDPILKSKFFRTELVNPFGLSAGFDKDASAVRGLSKLGFSFLEIGSVTKLPQPGNPKPRIFRFQHEYAIINSCGFNSAGYEQVYRNIQQIRSEDFSKLIGINLGVNKGCVDPISDYVDGVKLFANVADYFVINISSPNTAGLRDLHEVEKLKQLLSAINAARNDLQISIPLFLKLSPDLTFEHLKQIASVVTSKQYSVDGLIISNTSNDPEKLSAFGKNVGGISGKPLFNQSTQMIRYMYKLTNGKIYIIGSGGVFSGQDAFDKIAAGASLVQIYSGLVFEGPNIIRKCERELIEILKEHGFQTITDAIGSNVQ